MGALIYVLFIAFLVSVFLFLSKSFRRLPKALQFVVLAVAALLVAVLATFELFIYLHNRWIEFLAAIRPLPWWVVVLVFLAITSGFFVLFRFLGTKVDSRGISDFFKHYITPQAKEFVRDLKAGEGPVDRLKKLWKSEPGPDDDTKPR